ncbi:MAG: metallophosphoesterase family protein [Planctomycetota bacterium]|jgi:3',5'-cyclic AMP phosphodiesterase CpdA
MAEVGRRSQEGDRPIRILHLSDFHLSKERQWDSHPVLRGLADTIGKLIDDGLGPDVAVITGDIAHQGSREDYQAPRAGDDEWDENLTEAEAAYVDARVSAILSQIERTIY